MAACDGSDAAGAADGTDHNVARLHSLMVEAFARDDVEPLKRVLRAAGGAHIAAGCTAAHCASATRRGRTPCPLAHEQLAAPTGGTPADGDGSSGCSDDDEDGEGMGVAQPPTPLMLAAAAGALRCVKLLASVEEVDVRARTLFGVTALRRACMLGQLPVARWLAQLPASPPLLRSLVLNPCTSNVGAMIIRLKHKQRLWHRRRPVLALSLLRRQGRARSLHEVARRAARRFFDAHAHLHLARVAPHLASMVTAARHAGVERVAVNGVEEGDWPRLVALCEDRSLRTLIAPQFGVHPCVRVQ